MIECDKCGQRSYMHAFKGDLELDFCRHHGIEHNGPLEAAGWTIQWDLKGIEHLTPGIKIPV